MVVAKLLRICVGRRSVHGARRPAFGRGEIVDWWMLCSYHR
jgi:hypothetical protein